MIPLNNNLLRLKRSGIRQFTNLAKTVPDCVMLTLGEPDFDTDSAVKEAAALALRQNRTHYAPNQGVEALRRAICDYEAARGLPCVPSQVLVTAGASEALYTAITGILNPGDEVIIPTPAFVLYETIVIAAGGVPVYLDTKAEDFQITATALEQVVTEKTKAIILNSPNNPTGTVLTDASLSAVKHAILGKPIFLICDNVYQALAEEKCPDLSIDPELNEQILLCQSFSKPYAMTGWRLGWLVGPADVIEKLLLLHAAILASVPTFIQDAGIAALDVNTTEMAHTYARRRAFVCRQLTEMGLSFPEPKGAFYVFPDISRFGLSDDTFCTRRITEGGVATVPGSCFGTPGHIRISYCCSDEALEEGMTRLERFIQSL